MGRPSKITTTIQAEILERLCNGETAKAICRDEHMPHWSNLCRFKREDDNVKFRDLYTLARREGMEKRMDDVWERVVDDSRDVIFDEVTTLNQDGDPKSVRKTAKSDNTPINRDRLIAEQARWEAARIYKDLYGEKVTTELTGANGGPVQYEQLVDKPPAETQEQWQERVTNQLTDQQKLRESVH